MEVGKLSRRIKVVITREEDGYVAYPLGLRGVVVAQGDTYEQVLSEITSAIEFHIETFGPEALVDAIEPQEAFIAETEVVV